MKRPTMSIKDRGVSADDIRAMTKAYSAAMRTVSRTPKVIGEKRKHRRTSAEEKEAKAQRTANAKKKRDDEREARELDRFLARVGYLSRRSEMQANKARRVHVMWKPSARPKYTTVCTRSLFSRLRPEMADRTRRAMSRSRVASDGFKNVVLRKTSRGFGQKHYRTRAYRRGEAADLARYILRPEGLEQGIYAVMTNVCTREDETVTSELGDGDVLFASEIAAFWNALEAFEVEADPKGNVFSHVIVAMPHELSPEGRVKALEDLCLAVAELDLPVTAALHRPDPEGDIRNYHAHIMMSARPFAREDSFAWSFEVGKATEFNLSPAVKWLRAQAAQAFNAALEAEGHAIRYSGLSQAERGVVSTGETHDGPAVTARKRRDKADHEERDRLTRELIKHVVRAGEQQNELGARIARLETLVKKSAAVVNSSATSESQLPPALAKLRQKFPDPLQLQDLSGLDILEFTSADRAADIWYSPALSLASELRRDDGSRIRVSDGKAELVVDKLDSDYRCLLERPALPDIVMNALIDAHQRLLDKRERQKQKKLIMEKIRRDRLAWLNEQGPTVLLDEKHNVLPEYRELFPPEVVALPGMRKALISCSWAGRAEENQKIFAERNAQPTFGGENLQGQADTEKPALTPDQDEELLLQAIRSGLVKIPGKGGVGR